MMLMRRVPNTRTRPARGKKTIPATSSIAPNPRTKPSLRRTFATDTKQDKTAEATATATEPKTQAVAESKPESQVSHRRSRGGGGGAVRSYDPFFDDWRDFSRRMDRYLTNSVGFPSITTDLFADPFADWSASFPRATAAMAEFRPSVDFSESDKAYHVHAELPGIPKENVHVSIRNGILEISGNKDFKKETKDDKRNFSRVERSYGSFVRRFGVPRELDAGKIKAKYENGVLELEVPKPEPTKQDQFEVKIE